MKSTNIAELEKTTGLLWKKILSGSKFIKEIMDGNATKVLYAIYMIETFHYTKHNARNQALVGVRSQNVSDRYIAYCFHHANEETGHENMALRDIRSLGFDVSLISQMRPLPATETLTAYLYWISVQGNPVQRLGYSFWAENVYSYIDPVLRALQETLGLQDSNLKFFIAHASIDQAHAEEVQRMILDNCKTDQDFGDVKYVLENTLSLTGRILDDVWDEYEKFRKNDSNRYEFLRDTKLRK